MGESIAVTTHPSDLSRAVMTTDQLDEGVPLTLDYRMDSRAGAVVVEAALREVLSRRGLGRKSPQQRHMDALRARVDAILAGLVHAHSHKLGKVRVSMSKRKGRDAGDALRGTIRELQEIGWLYLQSGEWVTHMQTTICAGSRLLGATLGVEDIVRVKQSGVGLCVLKDAEGEEIDWPDSDEARELANGVEAFNFHLEGVDIIYPILPGLPDAPRRWGVKTFRRSLREAGRIGGPAWQNLKPGERAAIILNGEPVREFDFGQTLVRIAYGRAGKAVPAGDLYAVPGVPRKGAKAFIIALLMADRLLKRYPEDIGPNMGGVPFKVALARVREIHAPIAHLFGTREGMKAIAVEAAIMDHVLRELRGLGTVGLPVHDSCLVPASVADVTPEIMREAFRKHSGVEALVCSK